MPRSALLALALCASACDTGGASSESEGRPDLPLVVGRFDGSTLSEAEDYTLRLYLEEDRLDAAGAVIVGVGGAVVAGESRSTVASTAGRRTRNEVRLVTTLQSGGRVGFSGDVTDGGRTLTGVVAGEVGEATFGPVGIVLRWQDLNYGG